MYGAERVVTPGARAFAWAGTIAFFGSLGYFAFAYLARFPRLEPDGLSPATAIVLNIVLFTVFALHHSLFARERIRAWVARMAPAGLERSFYVWVASGLLVAVCVLWRPVPGIAWQVEGGWRWVLLAALAAGVWLTLRSASVLDVLELSGIRQLAPRAGRAEFKTSGPYGWVRHPIYTGWCLMVFCLPTMTMTQLTFAVVSAGYLLVAIPLEERTMRASGKAYEAYARKVRWRMVPGVY